MQLVKEPRPTLGFNRHREGNSWVYDDDELNEIAMDWIGLRWLNLADFDTWLESKERPAERVRQLLSWRECAIRAQRAGAPIEAEGWARFLNELHLRHSHYEVLAPAAVRGDNHSKVQALRRKDKPSSDPYSPNRNVLIRSKYRRLLQDSVHDPVSQIANEFDLSSRQVRRIVNLA